MKAIDIVAFIFVLAGGINWGIVGVFDFNVIDYIFGRMYIDRIIYVLVGISALYLLFACQSVFGHFKKRKR